jgi:hypothetical protein
MTKKAAKPALPTLLDTQQALTYDLVVEPVPQNISLGFNRVWIVSIRKVGDDVVAKYRIPVQWTQAEANLLIEILRGVGWQLKEDNI